MEADWGVFFMQRHLGWGLIVFQTKCGVLAKLKKTAMTRHLFLSLFFLYNDFFLIFVLFFVSLLLLVWFLLLIIIMLSASVVVLYYVDRWLLSNVAMLLLFFRDVILTLFLLSVSQVFSIYYPHPPTHPVTKSVGVYWNHFVQACVCYKSQNRILYCTVCSQCTVVCATCLLWT